MSYAAQDLQQTNAQLYVEVDGFQPMKMRSVARSGTNLVTMAMSALVLWSSQAYPEDKPPPDDVVVVVNGETLTRTDFAVFVAMRTGQRAQDTTNPQQLKGLLDEYINRELIYQDAVRRGFDKAPEVAAALENQTRNTIASYAVRRLISAPIPENQLKAVYDKQMSKPTREYKARHILVRTEQDARDIINELRSGADFSKLAQEKSLDNSAKDGGNLGWFAPSQVVPPFAKAVMALDEGKYTVQPVETRYGWHVIRLDSTRIVPPPPFDSVKDKLTVLVNNQIIARYIASLRDQAKVEVQKR